MLSRTPFVSIAVIFISGILLAGKLSWQYIPVGLLAAVLTGLLVVSITFLAKRNVQVFGLTFALFVLCTGAAHKLIRDQALDEQASKLSLSGYDTYLARIESLPEKRMQSVRAEATVHKIGHAGQWSEVSFKTLLTFPKNVQDVPTPGTSLLVHGKLATPPASTGHWKFDYRRYLKNKGIIVTGRLRPGSYFAIQSSAKMQPWSTGAPAWADSIFRSHILDDEAYGLMKAMLLGRRDDLGAELVNDYTVSGAVHILSVSGMHVAIIFLVAGYLLGWLKELPHGRMLFLTVITGMLVFYAMVTGLPPSVQRATLMCIVFAFADVFQRKNDAMNTLGLSALLVLFWDPAAVYDVGFQLSYLAMSGIFLFYKPIEHLFSFDNRIIQYGWQVTALSFAAQLATFPLSLYYFHQFPTYFWLVNPFVILFTNILLPAALILLIVSVVPFAPLHWLVAQVVLWSGKLANHAVAVPDALPGNLIRNLSLDTWEVTMLFILLLLVWLAIHYRNYSFLKAGFALVLVFASYAIGCSTMLYLHSGWQVHGVPGHAVISLKKGNVLYFAADPDFYSDPGAYQYHLQNYEAICEVDSKVFTITPRH